jgi:hypothetical protein
MLKSEQLVIGVDKGDFRKQYHGPRVEFKPSGWKSS